MLPACSIALIMAPDAKTADRITDALLGKNLAACVNQIPQVKSKYWWEGKIGEAREILLIVKTRAALIPSLARCVKENHPYTVPEIISFQIADGHKPYLQWLETNTRNPSPSGSTGSPSRATLRGSSPRL